MLGQQIKHPKSTNYASGEEDDDGNSIDPPAKRVKSGSHPSIDFSSTLAETLSFLESETEPEDSDDGAQKKSRATDIESALPPINTDQEAIDEYEAGRAARNADFEAISERLSSRKWTRGKNSIYLDAFNLALETVLAEESHLFNEAENAVFTYWNQLSYEAQYL
jgi:Fanconi-associated nuclease 1